MMEQMKQYLRNGAYTVEELAVMCDMFPQAAYTALEYLIVHDGAHLADAATEGAKRWTMMAEGKA